MAFPTNPAVTFEDAVTLAIFSSSQLASVINGDNISTVDAEDGPIPTVRKVLKDIEDIGTNQFNVIFTDQNILTQNYRTYLVDTSLVPITATLPDNATQGQFVMIFDYVGQASTNNITVNTTDSSTINGGSTYTISDDYTTVGFWKDSTEWKAINTNTLASNISFTPTGNIAASNVQAALAELDTEKQSNLPVVDSTALVKGSADATKQVKMEVDGLTTATTRTITVPDQDVDLTPTTGSFAKAAHEASTDGHPNATTSLSGFMSSADKTKLDTVETNAAADQNASEVPFTPTGNLASTDTQAALAELDSNDSFIKTPVGSELTIATGAITVTTSYHTVDTEADAATDDLDTINGGTDGFRVVLRAADSTRTVVVKDGTGNLKLAGDFSLDNVEDTIELIYDTTLAAWLELSRSDNNV